MVSRTINTAVNLDPGVSWRVPGVENPVFSTISVGLPFILIYGTLINLNYIMKGIL
tara:strand:+ start:9635 stop:9802 length:168 start_codon:yes stop_codon:yes gene_type:complete